MLRAIASERLRYKLQRLINDMLLPIAKIYIEGEAAFTARAKHIACPRVRVAIYCVITFRDGVSFHPPILRFRIPG